MKIKLEIFFSKIMYLFILLKNMLT